jgi:hypothetical protein
MLVENVIENYLKENSTKKLSLKRITKDLSLKRRKAIWLIHQSTKIQIVKPIEVGCNKYFMHVYKYSE